MRERENIPVLLMCESFCGAQTQLDAAAQKAAAGGSAAALQLMEKLYKTLRGAAGAFSSSTSTHPKENLEAAAKAHKAALDGLNKSFETVRVLLSGVSKLKELSKKTSSLLKSLAREMSAYAVCAALQRARRESVAVVYSDRLRAHGAKPPNKSAHTAAHKPAALTVVAARDFHSEHVEFENAALSSRAKLDVLVAQSARAAKASRVEVWTDSNGIMTANAAYVQNARPVRFLPYSMALEIAALGGNVFHPTALQALMHDNIPIAVYCAQESGEQYASLIGSRAPKATGSVKSQVDSLADGTVIINQNSFSVCSVRSTDMFHRYGYLEKLFAVCSRHGVSVETLTTSEISITMTFPTAYVSQAFLADLRSLGDAQCEHDYSLISLVSSSAWNAPHHIAAVLRGMDAGIATEALSVSKAGLNFSFAVKTKHVRRATQDIHDVLYPRTASPSKNTAPKK